MGIFGWVTSVSHLTFLFVNSVGNCGYPFPTLVGSTSTYIIACLLGKSEVRRSSQYYIFRAMKAQFLVLCSVLYWLLS